MTRQEMFIASNKVLCGLETVVLRGESSTAANKKINARPTGELFEDLMTLANIRLRQSFIASYESPSTSSGQVCVNKSRGFGMLRINPAPAGCVIPIAIGTPK